jgi:hypothetical protein
VNFPTGDNASPQVDQLLGVNNSDVAVGFYTNGQGSNRGVSGPGQGDHAVRVAGGGPRFCVSAVPGLSPRTVRANDLYL